MRSSANPLPEVAGIVHNRVDLAMHGKFGRFQERYNMREIHAVSHDDEIDVAAGSLLAASDRTEYERDSHLLCERRERRMEHVDCYDGLEDKRPHLTVDGAGGVGAVEYLAATLLAMHKACGREERQFPLRGAQAQTAVAGNLAEVKRLIRMHHEQP
jgi:hypothetical protein